MPYLPLRRAATPKPNSEGVYTLQNRRCSEKCFIFTSDRSVRSETDGSVILNSLYYTYNSIPTLKRRFHLTKEKVKNENESLTFLAKA